MPENMGHFHFLRAYFPDLSDQQLELFDRARETYELWNSRINVVSRKDIELLPERHIQHSLAVAKVIRFNPGARVLDIGTGGGFPGIPLAIVFPEVQFTLADSIAKKISVVTEVVNALELKNVTPLRARAEELKEPFDYVVSRATAPMSNLVEWSRKQLVPGQVGSLPNGWLVLKGGELTEELAPYKKVVEVYPVRDFFKEEFFSEKSVVYLPRQMLK